MRYRLLTAAFAAGVAYSAGPVAATDLEVTHWWTSGGEAAAVAELAKAFDATGNKWIDAAIAGAGNTARPIMIARITGGDPMGAFQFNHGRQAEELIAAGLMQDLTEIATQEKWAEIVRPKSLLDACTLDGKIYCAPINIHSWQWLWLSNKAFEEASKNSIIRQIATTIHLKAGRSSFSMRGGEVGEKMHMSSMSHFMSLPRSESIDKVGSDLQRLHFNLDKDRGEQ